jgi:hypothetical protein
MAAKKKGSKKSAKKKATKKQQSSTSSSVNLNRGKTYEVKLKYPVKINGKEITKAIIELDHINFGINKKTKELNKRKRSNFSLKDVEQFLRLLDEEDIPAIKHHGDWSLFQPRIDCPIKNKFEGKEFYMIFKTSSKDSKVIHTITLYPAW